MSSLPANESAWLRTLLDHPHVILFTLDPEGRIRWVSPQVKTLLGFDAEALLGKQAISGLLQSHQATAQAHQAAKAQGQEDKATYETVVRGANGREVALELTSHAERDAQGRLLAVHGFAIDVTDRRQAREALERSRQRMADVLDDANDIVYLHGLEGHFMTVNAAAVATYGYTRDEFMRMSIRDLIDPAHLPRAAEEMRLKVEGKKQRSAAYELLTRAKDGRAVWVEVSTRAVLRDGRPIAIQGIARDITQRRADEAAVRLVEHIAVATADAPDFDAALELALEGMVEATGCARAEAWVPGTDQRLRLAAAWPEERSIQVEKFHRLSKRADFGLGEGLASRAWREGRAIWVPNLTHDSMFQRAAAAQGAGFNSLLAVPVLADGNLVALLILLVAETPAAPPRWSTLVESVAAQLGGLLKRRRVEDALRTNSELLQAQWQEAPVAVLLVDQDGVILGANRKFLALCGVEAAGPIHLGPSFLSSLPDPEGFTRQANRFYELRGTGADEVLVEGRTLRRFLADLKDSSGKPFGKVVYLRDVTEVRNMERQLAAIKQARQAAVFGAAHEDST